MSAYNNTLWAEAVRHLGAAGVRGRDDVTDLVIGHAKYYSLDPSARDAFRHAMDRSSGTDDRATLVEAALGFHRQSVNLRVDRKEATALLSGLLDGPLRNDRGGRLRVLTQLAEFSLESGSLVDGHEWLAEAETLVRADDPLEWRFGLALAAGLVRLEQVDLDGAWRAFAEAAELNHPTAPAAPSVRLATVALVRGDAPTAHALLDSAEERRLRDRQYWYELASLLAVRAAAWALLGDFDQARVGADDAIRWGRLSGSQRAEWQGCTVAVFAAREAGRSLVDVFEPGYTLPDALVLVSLLCEPDRKAARSAAAPLVHRFFERGVRVRGASLETIGVMAEWAVSELDDPSARNLAGELLATCASLGVRSFVGWPARIDRLQHRLGV